MPVMVKKKIINQEEERKDILKEEISMIFNIQNKIGHTSKRLEGGSAAKSSYNSCKGP